MWGDAGFEMTETIRSVVVGTEGSGLGPATPRGGLRPKRHPRKEEEAHEEEFLGGTTCGGGLVQISKQAEFYDGSAELSNQQFQHYLKLLQLFSRVEGGDGGEGIVIKAAKKSAVQN